MADIILKPWIGKNYYNGGIFGKKILALGHDHYDKSAEVPIIDKPTQDMEDLTRNIVEDYLYYSDAYDKASKRWMNTYKNFEKALVNNEIDKKESIWNSIIFYNYLQVIVKSPYQKVPSKYYYDAEKPFFDVLEEYKPDLIIVWGRGVLWNNMPDGDNVCRRYSKYIYDYFLKDGTKIKTIAIHHPSLFFSWRKWYNFIKDFLK